MSSLNMKPSGEIVLPVEICRRYGLTPQTPLRIVETRSGVLLVPLTEEPMDPALRQELAEWQELGLKSWELFPYEDE